MIRRLMIQDLYGSRSIQKSIKEKYAEGRNIESVLGKTIMEAKEENGVSLKENLRGRKVWQLVTASQDDHESFLSIEFLVFAKGVWHSSYSTDDYSSAATRFYGLQLAIANTKVKASSL